MRILQLFQGGKSVADICKEVFGVASNAGKVYQNKSADIQAAIRRGLAV